jgi:hypothetical protein
VTLITLAGIERFALCFQQNAPAVCAGWFGRAHNPVWKGLHRDRWPGRSVFKREKENAITFASTM